MDSSTRKLAGSSPSAALLRSAFGLTRPFRHDAIARLAVDVADVATVASSVKAKPRQSITIAGVS
jgi:hypothetical protein